MSLIWTNPTRSGLGDRFLDILIMLTYANVHNKTLKLKYPEQPFDNTDIERARPTYRREDYKLENIQKYMSLPNALKLYLTEPPIEPNDEPITDYFGGRYSPFDIHNKYRLNIPIYDFISTYYNVASEIKFNLNYDLEKYGPYISVHLRRTDKVWDHCGNDHHGIKSHELSDLNEKTCHVINEFISRGYKSIYFCGDDKRIIEDYSLKYKDKIKIINEDIVADDDIHNVYLDLYMLSNSKFIILSQRHSSFSLFASMLRQVPLIYLYHGDIIETASYTQFPHVIYYQDMFKDCYIIGHQGIGDLFSQTGLYTHYIDIFRQTTIFAVNTTVKKVIDSMFANKKSVSCIIPEFISSSNGNTCINCHTYGSGGGCPRDRTRTCIYINETNYSNGHIVKLSAFRNFGEWLSYYNYSGNFVDCFYKYQFFNKYKKFKNFTICIDDIENNLRFESIYKNKPYVLVHDTPDAKINTTYIEPSLEIIQLHQLSETMTDTIQLFLNAEEIHIIDSSYSLLLYYLSFSIERLTKKKVYLHAYARIGRDIEIYKHPIPENWYII